MKCVCRFLYYTRLTVDFATQTESIMTMEEYHQQQIDFAIDFAKQLQEWLSDADAQAEYQAWSESIRPDDAERVQTDAEKRAECYELARLEDYHVGHAINGDDLRWQQGGN